MEKPDQIALPQQPVPRKKLPPTVIVLGLVSFFNDFASDIVVPLIPILLATVLAAGPIALGLIEGVADAVASLLKLWAGRHSDIMRERRKGLAVAGYTLSNITRPMLGLAGSWLVILVLRSIDRAGKGLRSAPRDALVADATPPGMHGYAFGYHRAMDNGGAVAGSLVAAAVLAWSGLSLTEVILWSAVPGVIAVLLLGVGVKEDKEDAAGHRPVPPELPPLRWSLLSLPMRRYLLVLMLFTFARASETFILLLGHQLGVGTVELLLLWAALSLCKAATSIWGGQLADSLGRGTLMLIGWSTFSLSFLMLGQVAGSSGLWAVSIFYGLCAGMSEGAERAIISDYALPRERGTAFGWYHLMVGLAAIPAGLLFGSLWQFQSAATAFFFAGGLAAIAAVLLRMWALPVRKLNPN
ncbi:Nitrate/nitrite transporter NarK [Nitrosospira multiformis ATCC 25196]|uniref:Major facilitator superfamily MFS_1 n=1 Tax=Nitrosospira multiformis (strain ATCC 25196 / NCIMB 11849 / C 71) TaxID=323848 RepID=Q2YD36_NITMU|nr:MFS transporter [Nitrosospira multiformis]ABB73335.1 Major facilitator superfamily MFS_1 [Nitrosospira multiformis ATCC 25196]SEG01733.1 Nitrate/nitrite transporter NarK [Nitrosospira multiformis ATCC 25196]